MRILIAEVRHFFACVGYIIRPYDMLADRRRWWFQPRQRCGWSYGIQLVPGVAPPQRAPSSSPPPDFED